MKQFSVITILALMVALAPGFGAMVYGQEPALPQTLHSIVHIEIPTTDFQKSKAFYEALLGWKVQIDTVMNYATWEASAPPNGGFMKWDKISQEKETTLIYVLVEDVDAACRKSESLGGKTALPKQPVGDMGWFAVIQDPCGASLALWQEAKK